MGSFCIGCSRVSSLPCPLVPEPWWNIGIYIKEGRHIEVSRDVIFDENHAYRRSKDISIDFDDEDIPIFEEEVQHDNPSTIQEEEGPSEPIHLVIILSTRKRPLWLKTTLEDTEGYGATKGTFRESKRSKRYYGYATYMTKLIEAEPSTFEDAAHKELWKKAMQKEYQSSMKNGVWEIVPRPSDKSIVTSKWIYKIKHAVDGSIDKYKARFVARVFSQNEGIDYEETLAPIARYTTFRSLVSLVATMGWNIHQMDVKTSFLNGTIDEEVYIEQPEGFEVNNKDTNVCRLKKALYGLKQAPRAWCVRMDSYLLRIGFLKRFVDPNIYIKVVDNELIIILLYVDDLFIIGVE